MEQEEQVKQERQIKGIWIPIEIWKDKSLSWNEKILFLEIDSYTSKDKDCYFSNEYISELLGISIANASKTLSSLIKKGYVIKTKFDGRKRYIKSALSFSTSLPCQEQQPSHARAFSYNNNPDKDNNKKDNNKDKKIEDKSSKKEAKIESDEDEFVEKIYSLYPAKCPKRNMSLGKTYKDKERIHKLLRTYSREDIERVVKQEVNEKYGKCYMSNFSTFLNNFPDPNSLFGKEQESTSNNNKEDMMQKFLSLTESEQAKILQLDAYQYHMLPTSAKEGWMNNRKQFILQWFTENGQ